MVAQSSTRNALLMTENGCALGSDDEADEVRQTFRGYILCTAITAHVKIAKSVSTHHKCAHSLLSQNEELDVNDAQPQEQQRNHTQETTPDQDVNDTQAVSHERNVRRVSYHPSGIVTDSCMFLCAPSQDVEPVTVGEQEQEPPSTPQQQTGYARVSPDTASPATDTEEVSGLAHRCCACHAIYM